MKKASLPEAKLIFCLLLIFLMPAVPSWAEGFTLTTDGLSITAKSFEREDKRVILHQVSGVYTDPDDDVQCTLLADKFSAETEANQGEVSSSKDISFIEVLDFTADCEKMHFHSGRFVLEDIGDRFLATLSDGVTIDIKDAQMLKENKIQHITAPSISFEVDK